MILPLLWLCYYLQRHYRAVIKVEPPPFHLHRCQSRTEVLCKNGFMSVRLSCWLGNVVGVWPVFSPVSFLCASLCCMSFYFSAPLLAIWQKNMETLLTPSILYSFFFFLQSYRFFLVFHSAVCTEWLSMHLCALTVVCTVSVCRIPEDLSREVIQIQQREITLKEQNYTLNSR